jgi:diguanylate cyclase (GGDEF)-like protein/PAS domain S-box-containing protein
MNASTILLNQVFDVLDEAVMVTDADLRIVRVNAAFSRWTGFSAEEVLGLTPSMLNSEWQSPADRHAMWSAIKEQGRWHGEVWNRRKNGEIYPDRLTIAALTGSDGEVTHYVGSFVEASQIKEQERKLLRMAMYDELTELPNRRLLQIHLDQAMLRSQRHQSMLAVCMLDLDGFKPVNDVHGHAAGDAVLIALGQRLPAALRKSDMVARMGGDEFVLIIEDIAGLSDLEPILEKVNTAITTPIVLPNGRSIQVGTSMGILLYPLGPEDNGDHLLRGADQALYEAKTHKHDRKHFWALFGEHIQRNTSNQVQRLLDAGAVEVCYQPVLSNKLGRIVGIEALARLRAEDGRILLPTEFLCQLERESLTELSRQVLTQALADLARLDQIGLETPLWVSFNVEPSSFTHHCVSCLRGVVEASGIDPSRITLEILESDDFLERERDAALAVLNAIKQIGIRLALDDVGSAYASLMRLKELPIDEIKLDQGFVRTLEERPQDLHFVRVIQDLAMELKLDLVVEGVETEDIMDAMLTTGVPYLQGFSIARPLPFDDLRRFLLEHSAVQANLPQSLFGYCAGTMASHNSIKKMFMINPSEMDAATLGDSRLCRGHAVQHRLDCGDDDHPLARLHADYHEAIGLAGLHAGDNFKNLLWDEVEKKLDAFLLALLDEWRRRKESQGAAC